MAYNTKKIVTDKEGNPISQYYNKELDQYEPVEGSKGASKVLVENNDLSLIPILEKLSQLTGTVIDEKTRKSNELERIENENIRTANEENREYFETKRVNQEMWREDAEKDRIILYEEIEEKLNNGDFDGATWFMEPWNHLDREPKEGDFKLNIETWDIFQYRETPTIGLMWDYIGNIKGSDAEVTNENVISAIGYTPANKEYVDKELVTKSDYRTFYTWVIGDDYDVMNDPPLKGVIETLNTHISENTKHAHSPKNVGLENVDNIKQMPIRGGVLESYREKLVTLSGTSPTINLNNGNVFAHTLSGTTAYSITNAQSQAHSFTLVITQTGTVRTIMFPTSVKWQGGEIPDLSNANKTYILTFFTANSGTTWLGMFGGEF